MKGSISANYTQQNPHIELTITPRTEFLCHTPVCLLMSSVNMEKKRSGQPVFAEPVNPFQHPVRSSCLTSGGFSPTQMHSISVTLKVNILCLHITLGFPGGSAVKNWSEMQEALETQVRSLSREHPPEEELPTHSGILAWSSPWAEEPGRLQSTGSQRFRYY